MISNTESYIDKSYLSKFSPVATYIFCSALLAPSAVGALPVNNLDVHGGDKCIYTSQSQLSPFHETCYQNSTPTWTPLDNVSCADLIDDTVFDASVSLDVVKKLAFMTVDENVDKAIDDYFSSKPIRSKIIFENHRIKKG